jgi:putative heme iron utilization protein
MSTRKEPLEEEGRSMSPGEEARRFVRSQRYGILSTLSKKLEGYPFGSVVPYVLDQSGAPIILISTLAEHTKNINHDPRVSLLLHEPSQDVQANARITLVGDAAILQDQDSFRARYLRYLPQAEGYFATHDFFFYRITPQQLRFIGGFGAIHWVSAESYRAPENELAELEDGILEHMNQDHADSLRAYCYHVHGHTPANASMIGIDCDGFDVRADGHLLRFEFSSPIVDAQGARAALVAMAKEARQ